LLILVLLHHILEQNVRVLYNMLNIYMFRPFFRPSSGCIRLALRVMYPDDKLYYFDDEISTIL